MKATPSAAIPMKLQRSTIRLRGNISAASERMTEVVLDRELHADIVGGEAIASVLATPVLHLRSEHHVLDRIEQHVDQRVVATLERIRGLAVRIVDVDHRIADGARQRIAPIDVEKRTDAEQWQRLTDDGPHGIGEVVANANIGR